MSLSLLNANTAQLCAWMATHMRWLATLKLKQAAQGIALQECLLAVTEAAIRIARLEQAMRAVQLVEADAGDRTAGLLAL